MLYFLHGTDSKKVRAKLDQLVTILKTKKPLAPIVRLTAETFSIEQFNQVLEEQSLFTEKNIVILDTLLKEHQEIFDRLEDIKRSEHVCILIEGKVSEKDAKKIVSAAEKVEEHNEVEKRYRHLNFEVTDAFSVKNNHKAWAVLTEAGDSLVPEEMHGTMIWQVKTLILAMNCGSAKEAGISPYAFQKAKSASRMWTMDELLSTQNKLFKMYHDARRGAGDLGLSLERFFLV